MPLKALTGLYVGGFVHAAVHRKPVAAKNTFGLFVSEPIAPLTTLMAVPAVSCISPVTIMATPAGKRIAAALKPSYTAGGTKGIIVTHDTTLVVAFTALSLTTGPLCEYLNLIPSDRDEDSIRAAFASAAGEYEKYVQQLDYRRDWIHQAHADIVADGITDISLESLVRANSICGARVITLGTSETLGGLTLVPGLDLVNHDDDERNIGAILNPLKDDDDENPSLESRRVIAYATRAIEAGEELVFPYLGGLPADATPAEVAEQRLLFVHRFGFIPKYLALV